MNCQRLFSLFIPFFITSHALAQPGSFASAKSFAFQLQNLDIPQLAASPFDVVVIDYSLDGSQAQAFSAEQIALLKASGKVVLSYLSIGEAEDYRFYFKRSWIKRASGSVCSAKLSSRAPRWLDQPNRNWCGNYKTKFWDRRWQKIIFGNQTGPRKSYLDRIIDAGFDGVYLDIIDGFEYWLNKPKSKRRKTAGADMASFVESLAAHARTVRGKPGFVIVPQNGAGIIDELSSEQKAEYFAAIDGIGAEDTFYFGDRLENNTLNPQDSTLSFLRQFHQAGKVVLSLEYLTETEKITDYISRACAQGFIPQVVRRKLDDFDAMSTTTCLTTSQMPHK